MIYLFEIRSLQLFLINAGYCTVSLTIVGVILGALSRGETDLEKGLLEKTGKSLAQWIAIVRKTKLEKYGDIMKCLKSEHGVTHGYANFITLQARQPDTGAPSGEALVTAQYEKKQDLRPIYDLLIKKISAFGKDVEVSPKETSVSLRRKRQFALIKPATKTRIDLGLKFNEKLVEGRLENSGPFGTMCSHRVQIVSIKDVDKELIGWLKEAYQDAN